MTTTYLNGSNALDLDSVLSPKEDGATSKRSNALSNKLTSVLSSSYADSETRDALRLLDLRGVQNVSETRAEVKFDAQKEVIDANTRILEDFGKVAKSLQRVGSLMTILNQTCDSMRTHILAAKQETAPVLEEASVLLARKQETETRQALLESFKSHFLVSDQDLTTLTSSAEPINDHFFTVLSRVKGIHKDCQLLLGHENQRLGLELMEQTTRNLDSAYKKLYNWIQREFKGLDLEDPRASNSIRRSLRALSERPTLFQNCLDLFGEAREGTLSSAFQTALTDSIGATAIEFSTHDPLRYIGDMLAWVHSAAVSEKEALEGLFISDAAAISHGLNEGKTSEPWARLKRSSSSPSRLAGHRSRQNSSSTSSLNPDDNDLSDEFDGHAALASLISRNLSAVSRNLSHRIDLSIRNMSDPLSIYRTYNVLLFYEDTFFKLFGNRVTASSQTPSASATSSSPQQEGGQYRRQPPTAQPIHAQNSLLATLSTLQSQALTVFTTHLQSDLEAEPAELPANDDLTAPDLLLSNLSLFSSILHLRAPNLTPTEFSNLYQSVLSPILRHCGSIAEELSLLEIPGGEDAALHKQPLLQTVVYQLNFLEPVVETLSVLARDQDLTLSGIVRAPLIEARNRVADLSGELVETVFGWFMRVSAVGWIESVLLGYKSDLNAITEAVHSRNTSPTAGGANSLKNEAEKRLTPTNPTTSATTTLLRDVSDLAKDPEVKATLVPQLEQAAADLDQFLGTAAMDAADELSLLNDKRIAKAVVAAAVDAFCARFEEIAGTLEQIDAEWAHERMADEKHPDLEAKDDKDEGQGEGVEEEEEEEEEDDVYLRELYPRTPEEVKALLS